MRKQRGEASSGGIGALGALGLIFVTLKLLGAEPVSSWSWWWVTAPFWAGFVLVAIGFAIVVIVMAVRRIARHCRHGR